MFEEEKQKEPLIHEELRQLNNNNPPASRISYFVERVYTVNGLHFASAVTQVLLGTSVVALSLVGSIQPIWLATVMTMFGSISTMIGLYLMYNTLLKTGAFDSLLQKAIRRVINSQN